MPVSDLLACLRADVQRHHAADGRAGGHHRPLHPEIGRDSSGREERRSHHRQPYAVREGGRGEHIHQEGHRVRGQSIYTDVTQWGVGRGRGRG